MLTFLRLGFFFFGTTPPFSSASSSSVDFRFLRAPFLRDLVLLLGVLVTPEVFFTVILVVEDLTNLLLATGMIFTLDGRAAALTVGEGLGLKVDLTEVFDVTTGAVAPLSVAVAVLVPVLVGIPVPSDFSDWIFSPMPVLVLYGIVPPVTEAALGGEVAATLSVVVSGIAVEVDEIVVSPALALSF